MEASHKSKYWLHAAVIYIPVRGQVPSLDILHETVQHILPGRRRDTPDLRSIRRDMRQYTGRIIAHLDTVTGRIQ